MAEAPKRTSRRSTKPKAVRRTGRTRAFSVDPQTAREIAGIALCALAIAVAIAVLTRSEGPAARYVDAGLRTAFGLGVYLVPVVVLAWGVSFFLSHVDLDEAAIGAGLAVAFLAFVSILSVSAPARTQWTSPVLTTHGGYAGGGVAWVLRSMLGQPISYVVLVAVLIIGLLLATRLSIAAGIGALRARRAPAGEKAPRAVGARRERAAAPAETFEPSVAVPAAEAGRTRRLGTPSDPEVRRRTVPAPHAAAPRAMEGFELPAPELLRRSAPSAGQRASEKDLRATGQVIVETLATFDVPARVTAWVPGPTVTMFEVDIAPGVKVSKVTVLADDLAMALAAPTIRILAPIPGKSLIGIEVPNERRSTITLGDVIADAPTGERTPLLLGIGKDVSGEAVVEDLAAMPHLLIAGSTGTGKSVCINAILTSILMRATPAEVRLILIDPKRIELSLYNGLPHLYVPVVTEAKEAASALAWAVSEMEARLRRLQKAGARNIGAYNALAQEGRLPEDMAEMPYIVIVIDELADLMMVAAKEVEDSICRLAQLARAAGIHLVVATQRPSTDIITGLIKTNITNRVAFAVGSSIDSRVILDQTGAEKLVGLGDMLYSKPAWARPRRIQGAFVSEEEIAAVVAHVKTQAEPDYHEEILHLKVAAAGGGIDHGDDDDDPLLWEAADIVVTSGMGSTSLLQRRLKVGYARAGRIMDMLEQRGVVGAPDGSRPREVLCDIAELESLKAFERSDGVE